MKAWRAVWLASFAPCALGLAAASALAGDASMAWSGLWRTPDQQGQALLDAGDPAGAAARFHDPRRRAYADLQAGRYQDAAKLLRPLTDAQSEYNLGNALAKSGQLQPALAAYDAALKQSPADKDIRHNRDLVARALRQQPPSPQSSRNGGQSGKKSGSSGQQKSGTGQQKGAGSQQPGAHGQQSEGGAPNDSRAGGNGTDAGSSSQPQSGQGSGDNSREAPGQARRDAEEAAALTRQQRRKPGASGQQPQDGGKETLAGGMQTPEQKPETERQLALDQWLRQIPDSPAGLLQRKFLIEHMVKQQGSAEPQGGNP
ncbi:MAG TPA: hypothetical protein VFX20_07955 [Steroidobacteraceae bacterium]|nr:hypothetical protein [Steroidobacteraceae bacterium]